MKYSRVAELIKERIWAGEYLAAGLPAERDLAAHFGVSYMTARRAVEQLVDDRVLVRKANRRADVNPTLFECPRGLMPSVAFLAPVWSSEVIAVYKEALLKAAERHGLIVKTIMHSELAERLVTETLTGYDIVFFLPFTDPLPPSVSDCLRKTTARVIALEYNLTHLGIPSVLALPPTSVRTLLDYVASLGHRHLDCINTQPADSVNREWIGQWRLWCSMNGAAGMLYDYPEPVGGDPRGVAYRVTRDLIESRQLDATALVCTTIACAEGCMRAFHDEGIDVGRDISLCTLNGERVAQYRHPSLTSLVMSDTSAYLNYCIEQALSGSASWPGPMLLAPVEAQIFPGESTAPAALARVLETATV